MAPSMRPVNWARRSWSSIAPPAGSWWEQPSAQSFHARDTRMNAVTAGTSGRRPGPGSGMSESAEPPTGLAGQAAEPGLQPRDPPFQAVDGVAQGHARLPQGVDLDREGVVDPVVGRLRGPSDRFGEARRSQPLVAVPTDLDGERGGHGLAPAMARL